MTNEAIRTIIRDRLGIDVMPDGRHVDANQVHLAVKEADKRGLILWRGSRIRKPRNSSWSSILRIENM